MTASPKKTVEKSTPDTKPGTGHNQSLNTEAPLSEKDEVKQAEERTAKTAKPPRKP